MILADFSDKQPFGIGQNGFATNFGHNISGEGHLGAEGIVVAQILKILVSRLSTTLTDPTKSDNVVRGHTLLFLRFYILLIMQYELYFNLRFLCDIPVIIVTLLQRHLPTIMQYSLFAIDKFQSCFVVMFCHASVALHYLLAI